jgi:hypothetical protein
VLRASKVQTGDPDARLPFASKAKGKFAVARLNAPTVTATTSCTPTVTTIGSVITRAVRSVGNSVDEYPWHAALIESQPKLVRDAYLAMVQLRLSQNEQIIDGLRQLLPSLRLRRTGQLSFSICCGNFPMPISSSLPSVEGAEPGDLLVVDLLAVGTLPESLWGFDGFFSKKNGGGFLTDHFPLAQKSTWDISGLYTHSRYVPGVNLAGLTHCAHRLIATSCYD